MRKGKFTNNVTNGLKAVGCQADQSNYSNQDNITNNDKRAKYSN